jgi:calcineurin-like phosphoesterase family protein
MEYEQIARRICREVAQTVRKEAHMINVLKWFITPERQVYLSSDLHLNHDKPFVVQSRGFKNVTEHNDGVIESLNKEVRPNDILCLLGDFCLKTSEQEFEDFISRIKCQNVYMLWGNHNNPVERIYKREVAKVLLAHSMHPNTEIYPFRYKNLIFAGHYLEVFIDNHPVVMCHYPISSFNMMKHGAYMLCGHSHQNYEMTRASHTVGRYLDVGWDGHKKPLTFKEVKAIMDKKLVITVDHH